MEHSLSLNEVKLLRNVDFLHQKRAALAKVAHSLSWVESELKTGIDFGKYDFPDGILLKSGKISRGENYKGLPYRVLDFPRYSEGNKVFIYRTMFWWGHYFLCLLITQNCGYRITDYSAHKDLVINTSDTPWDFDIKSGHWVPLGEVKADFLHPFIAIGTAIEFERFNDLAHISKTTFESVMTFLAK